MNSNWRIDWSDCGPHFHVKGVGEKHREHTKTKCRTSLKWLKVWHSSTNNLSCHSGKCSVLSPPWHVLIYKDYLKSITLQSPNLWKIVCNTRCPVDVLCFLLSWEVWAISKQLIVHYRFSLLPTLSSNTTEKDDNEKKLQTTNFKSGLTVADVLVRSRESKRLLVQVFTSKPLVNEAVTIRSSGYVYVLVSPWWHHYIG